MSNVLYPIGLVSQLDVERIERVIADNFEDGSTSARNTWPAQNFKRKFTITHAPLKQSEYKWLRSFHSQRSGGYDSFWYRDNINRRGNAQVRFMSDLKDTVAQMVIGAQVTLGEIAPVRALPEFDEMAAAAGFTPVLWYDANREYYLQHLGAAIYDSVNSTWDVMENYRAPWQSGSGLQLGSVNTAYNQYYIFYGTQWAKTAANISQLSAGQPACTIFIFTNQSSSSTEQVLFSIGGMNAGFPSALGIILDSDNKYKPWLNSTGTWTSAVSTNPNNTWQSIAVVFAGSANTEALYVNGALIGTDTNTRNLVAGPAALGAAPDSSLILNPSNSLSICAVTHAIVFAGALTLAQIKAVHNLLGYQYGLASV